MKHAWLLLLPLLLLIACNQHDASRDHEISVVTSIFPLCDITRHIAGEHVAVTYVIPVGANPHHYEPLPSTVLELQQATLFIGIHRDFDGWIADLLPDDTRRVFLLSENRAQPRANPHIWLTPGGGMSIADSVARMLSNIDPRNRAYYLMNLSSYKKELEQLDSTITLLFDHIVCKKFIQWHPAWDYLAHDYNLTIIATIEHGHGAEPSVRQFKQLIDRAKEQHVKVIVTGLYTQKKAAGTLAREIDGVLLKLDPIGDPAVDARATYLKMLYHNALLLSSSLNETARNGPVIPESNSEGDLE